MDVSKLQIEMILKRGFTTITENRFHADLLIY